MAKDWLCTPEERQVCQALAEVQKQVGAKSVQALAIACVMQKVPCGFPIVGGRKVEHLDSNIEALDVALSEAQIKYLGGVLPFDKGFPRNFVGDGESYTGLMKNAAQFEKWPMQQAIRPSKTLESF
ncbi:uncharacterized protein BXZ73DRAFT_102498 [Epithele typhae]|uniref:uncharacterized protein n=1 Tax=Epithele typhae TaxID=378194 RepID=UPI002007702C|nr:uncharacterized protein BXZ73DRAFT_102498 [Epithele typhae]KAH9927990.1 hypothetical protein BXZ73DRAFT_102498 [Epithele typhae]